jgi:UDP-glucuronate decarboxylase
MRILVTGGSGFIGSNLTERLLSLGHQVLVIDNFYTSDKKNIQSLIDNPNLEVVRHDVTNPYSAEVDAIYHLACPASPVHYQRFPVQTIKTCILGSINMLDLAQRLEVPILLSSTSEVYGDPTVSPQNEEYWGNVNPIGIRSCYDEGKRAAETLFFDYHRQYNVNIKVARIFNTYGPNMSPNDGRVVSNFIVQALRSEDITIYGDGNQTRSFCYVDDQVEGIFKLLHSDYIYPVNIGNPDEITIKDFADEIIKLTGTAQKVVYHPIAAARKHFQFES